MKHPIRQNKRRYKFLLFNPNSLIKYCKSCKIYTVGEIGFTGKLWCRKCNITLSGKYKKMRKNMKINYEELMTKFKWQYSYKTTVVEETLMTDFAMFVVSEIGIDKIRRRLKK